MDYEKLKGSLEAWRKAYGVFSHGQGPSRQFVGGANTRALEDWLGKNSSQFPATIRPGDEELASVANMLSSFLATSINDRAFKLRSGGGREGRRLESRAKAQATMLERFAVERLGEERGVLVSEETFQHILAESSLAADLVLFTYAGELVRRTEFASQGLSVYWLWLELEEDLRVRISVDKVKAAESRLVAAMIELSKDEENQ